MFSGMQIDERMSVSAVSSINNKAETVITLKFIYLRAIVLTQDLCDLATVWAGLLKYLNGLVGSQLY